MTIPRQCALLAVLLLIAAAPIDSKNLVGTWKNSADGFSQTLTINKDHTFNSKMTGPIERTDSGTWKLDGQMLVQTIKKSTNDDMKGKEMRVTIHSLSGDTLELQPDPSDPKELVKFTREKSK